MSMDTNVEIKVVKRIENSKEANSFLRDLEKPDSNCTQGVTSLICESHRETRKYVVLDCSADMAREIIISHVRDVNMGRRNFHFLLTSLVMDEYLNNRILELGVLNVTGFRVVQPHRDEVRDFIRQWQKLDPIKWPGAGTDYLRADVALLHDTALVILDAFSRLLKNKPDIFRNNTRRGEIYNRGQRGVDCQGNPTVPWEHGEVIVDYLRSIIYAYLAILVLVVLYKELHNKAFHARMRLSCTGGTPAETTTQLREDGDVYDDVAHPPPGHFFRVATSVAEAIQQKSCQKAAAFVLPSFYLTKIPWTSTMRSRGRSATVQRRGSERAQAERPASESFCEGCCCQWFWVVSSTTPVGCTAHAAASRVIYASGRGPVGIAGRGSVDQWLADGSRNSHVPLEEAIGHRSMAL
ncbi:glutamate receptor 1-like [Tropilaelaps mercedesae]|uniref:Glutamate receptor 1-like n=1 Tax=Tropilaelaps mercedesae TaxID=418985 RepID=A0A1V9XMT3_9ACAR|nr:glutamate receptor 1-like [Tropilaelaps mercedesae]